MKLLKKIRDFIKALLGIRTAPTLEELKSQGMRVGENLIYESFSTRFDISHCWLIDIGNDVTLCTGVCLLAHDASTKKELGYTKIGLVKIEDKAFIGINSVIMPGVTVGKGSIVGTGSIVTHDVPAGCVYAGNPAKFICTTEEYYKKQKDNLSSLPVFDGSYTVGGNVTEEKKQQMIAELKNNGNKGFVV